MSIVVLKKVTIYGHQADKSRVLEDLQTLGCLHLIPLSPDPDGPGKTGPSSEAREALHYLQSCPQRRKQVHDAAKFDPEQVERDTLALKRQIKVCEDGRDLLLQYMANLRPWGEFSFPPLADLNQLRFWFYQVPHYQMKAVQATDYVWEVVKHDNRFYYVVVIAEHEPENMPAPRVHVGSRPLSELQRQLEEVEIKLEDLQAARQALTRWYDLYARSLAHLEDRADRDDAAQRTYDENPLFALQAWTPATDVDRLHAYAQQHALVLEVAPPLPEEKPPTLLKTPQWFGMGKHLVLFYMTPGYRLWDPSITIFLSFIFFFAMILGDAGYAAVLGAFLFWKWRKFGQSEQGWQFRVLLGGIVGLAVVWGMMAGSYFGVTPANGSFLSAFHVLNVNDYGVMMAFSILVGVMHLTSSNFADHWCKRGTPQKWLPIGWIGILWGGFLIWMATSDPANLVIFKPVGVLLLVMSVGTRLLPRIESLPLGWMTFGLGGFLTWMGFSATAADRFLQPVGLGVLALGGAGVIWYARIDRVWWKRLLGGFTAVPKLSGIFGDTLSYLRLFALGLAGSSLSMIFNDLSAKIDAALPGIGLLLALLVLAFGHVLTFVLSLMGAVIHGLRLNYIEFFNWSMPEEGYLFKAFARKEKVAWKES